VFEIPICMCVHAILEASQKAHTGALFGYIEDSCSFFFAQISLWPGNMNKLARESRAFVAFLVSPRLHLKLK
jgi:hypothetical protein